VREVKTGVVSAGHHGGSSTRVRRV
jgi:hypothetical protein